MTAKRTGLFSLAGFWRSVRRVRDQWVVLVFLATALFWTRDVFEQFIDLPAQVAELHSTIEHLRADVTRLDKRIAVTAQNRSAALVFPGTGHGVEDGALGTFVTVRLQPAKRVRDDCRTTGLAAYMIDASGRWFMVDTSLGHVPQISSTQDLAFAARIHPRMTPGRAQFLVQVTLDCGSHRQVDSSPRLHFRVLPSEHEQP